MRENKRPSKCLKIAVFVVAAAALAAAAPGLAAQETLPPATLDMVYVQGGRFSMGTPMLTEEERPLHDVTVSSFYISKFEVTVADFAAYLDEFMWITTTDLYQNGQAWNSQTGKWEKNPDISWDKPGFEQTDDCPVVLVSWEDAADYCNYLSRKEHLEEVYQYVKGQVYKADYTKNGYRLPSEAEWEFAAVGGAISQKARFRYIGSNNPDAVAWLERTSGGTTHPVGKKQPNQLGLYDMGGNAAEWCDDWYAPYTADPATDPHVTALSKEGKIIRGTSFIGDPSSSMPGFRDKANPDSAWNDTGFRVVRASGPGTALPMTTTTTTTTTTLPPPPVVKVPMITVEGGAYKGQTVKTFLVGQYEITNELFETFVARTGYKTTAETGGGGYIYENAKTWVRKADATWKNPYVTYNPLDPVVDMSWYDAAEFCNWLSGLAKLSPVYSKQGSTYTVDLNQNGFRLPTEIEWEYAAKGGRLSKGFAYAGADKGEKVAWSSFFGASGPHSGGGLAPNELGIYDMCGNVWEWCTELLPESGKTGVFKAALRGGSWTNKADYCTIDRRTTDFLEGTDYTFGFRVVRPK